jgi:FlaA1/EpsC-like NDP-sugar epimerase
MKIFYPVKGRKYYYLILDCVIVVGSYLLSYIIRFYPDLETYLYLLDPKYFYYILPSFILSFYFFQIYRIMWAYSNINDVYRLMLGNISGLLLFIFSIFFFQMQYSRLLIILSFLIISTSTIFYRILIRDYFSRKTSNINGNKERNNKPDGFAVKKRVLIIGAGEAGRNILSEYTKKGLGRTIVGFIDDDKYKTGKMFNGKMIFGTSNQVEEIIIKKELNEVIIAMPSEGAGTINRIVTLIKSANQTIPIKIVPSMMELFKDQPLLASLREVSIIDLIGREEFKIDGKTIRDRFEEKTILVTGAGGSIGSEICKQILKFDIKRLIAIGRGENSIYNLIKSLNEYVDFIGKKPEIIYKIIDVKDYPLLEMVFNEYRPDIVFHAAAHKHVPLMEFNEIEALQNNVGGTLNVLEVSAKNNVKDFVLISTDKAVRPVNIMGASKRIAEIITDYYYKEKGLKTSIVRFGNVIGSRGSVIPLFREQIEKGGPITVTHPEITRFFMSIPEASLLVINAVAYSNGGECFVLDMGKQYKILDIANNLIKLCGYEPEKDIKIVFTGLRPGEKLYEELSYDCEHINNTKNEKIFVIDNNGNGSAIEKIEHFINQEIRSLRKYDVKRIRGIIKDLIPEYDYSNYSESCEQYEKMVN